MKSEIKPGAKRKAGSGAKNGSGAMNKIGPGTQGGVRREIQQIAREKLGFDQLYPAQLAAIETILQGRDVLVITPTGSGKSAIYQIPALMLPRPAVVISPLIALQKDQIESIEQQDVAEAAVVNSMQHVSELISHSR